MSETTEQDLDPRHEIERSELVQKVYAYFVHGFATNRSVIYVAQALSAVENRRDHDEQIEWGSLGVGGFVIVAPFGDPFILAPSHHKCRENRVKFLQDIEALDWFELFTFWLSLARAQSFIRGFLECLEEPLNAGI